MSLFIYQKSLTNRKQKVKWHNPVYTIVVTYFSPWAVFPFMWKFSYFHYPCFLHHRTICLQYQFVCVTLGKWSVQKWRKLQNSFTSWVFSNQNWIPKFWKSWSECAWTIRMHKYGAKFIDGFTYFSWHFGNEREYFRVNLFVCQCHQFATTMNVMWWCFV